MPPCVGQSEMGKSQRHSNQRKAVKGVTFCVMPPRYCSYDDSGAPIPGSGPPKLSEPSQVWELIDEPVVCIPWIFRSESAVEFELSFNCEWDREHGLGVLYHDFRPVEFGGWDL